MIINSKLIWSKVATVISLCLDFVIMLRSLPLRNMVNMSSQLENSICYHFQSGIDQW